MVAGNVSNSSRTSLRMPSGWPAGGLRVLGNTYRGGSPSAYQNSDQGLFWTNSTSQSDPARVKGICIFCITAPFDLRVLT